MNLNVLAFEFPPINVLLRWQDVAPTINKVVLIGFAAALIGIGIFSHLRCLTKRQSL